MNRSFRFGRDTRPISKTYKAKFIVWTFPVCFLLHLFLVMSVNAQAALPGNVTSWQDKIAKVRTHDFGDISIGKLAQHSFELVNTTDEVLHIQSVSASCGCTLPSISKNQIDPGEKAYVRVRLNSDRYRGKKSSTIHVRINGDQPREIQFSISVNFRNLMIEPEIVEFKSVRPGEQAKEVLTISRGGSPYWKIDSVFSSSSSLKAKITSKSVVGRRVIYKIECIYEGDGVDSLIQEEVVFKTNDSSEPEIKIPVRINVTLPIKASVSTLGFDIVDVPVTKKLFVETADVSTISRIIVGNDRFEVTEVGPASKKFHLFDVKCLVDKSLASEATLTIEANGGKLKSEIKLIVRSQGKDAGK